MRLLRHLLSPVVTEQREGTQLDALPYVCVYVRSRGGNSLDRDVTLNSVMQLDADSVPVSYTHLTLPTTPYV